MDFKIVDQAKRVFDDKVILHCDNTPIQYTAIFKAVKMVIFRGKLLMFFLFLLKT